MIKSEDLSSSLSPEKHNYIIDMEVFEIYKSEDAKLVSIKSMIDDGEESFNNIIFQFS